MTNTLFAHVRVHAQYMLYYVSCIHVSVVFDENNLLFLVFWPTFYTEQQVITDVSVAHRELESGRICCWFTSTHY
jgi:hypothetical protein